MPAVFPVRIKNNDTTGEHSGMPYDRSNPTDTLDEVVSAGTLTAEALSFFISPEQVMLCESVHAACAAWLVMQHPARSAAQCSLLLSRLAELYGSAWGGHAACLGDVAQCAACTDGRLFHEGGDLMACRLYGYDFSPWFGAPG